MMQVKNFFWFCIDFIIPPQCILCHAPILRPGHVCGECWSRLTFITQPCCRICGFPLELAIDKDLLCGACLKEPPLFEKARSAIAYDDVSKPLILKFKHGDGTYLAPPFIEWMHYSGKDLIKSADYLVPVPLHWKRLITRRYNQAALLAKGLSKRNQVPVLFNALKRIKNTPSQGRLSQQERHRNVKSAFVVKAKHRNSIKNKKIVLIDDVMTTGATLQSCTRTLLQHHAASVTVLTLARVV